MIIVAILFMERANIFSIFAPYMTSLAARHLRCSSYAFTVHFTRFENGKCFIYIRGLNFGACEFHVMVQKLLAHQCNVHSISVA